MHLDFACALDDIMFLEQRTFNGFVSEWSNTDKPALQICAICLKNVPANYLIFTLEDCAYTFVLPDYIISAFELNHVYK